MKLLALDVSTKTGFAVFEDGRPTKWGTVFPDKTAKDFGAYPENYVKLAEYLVDRLLRTLWEVHDIKVGRHLDSPVGKITPAYEVVIEETNPGKNCYSQKQLDYLHFCLVKRLTAMGLPVYYVRTGEWRRLVGGNLSKEEKAINAKVSRIKKQTGKKLAKIDGKVVGKKTRKHSALRVCQEEFGIELRKKDEDASDALCLGLAFLREAARCDGTVKGGIGKKVEGGKAA